VIRYADPARKEILSEDWRVDNFELSSDGSPKRPKNGPKYKGTRDVDDGEGSGDLLHEDFYVFDLELVHRSSGGVIWARTIPLPPALTDTNLRVLMDDYAAALSGTGFFASDVVSAGGNAVAKAQEFATKVVQAKQTSVAGHDAYDATIELANVDQIKLDPNRREAIGRIVLVRTDYFNESLARRHLNDEHKVRRRIVMMLGYSNNPTDFPAQLPDFERFISQISLGPPQ
jgi:hypothetical protein